MQQNVMYKKNKTQTLDILYIPLILNNMNRTRKHKSSSHKTEPGQRPRNIEAVSALFFLAHGGY